MDPKEEGLLILKTSPNAMKGVEIFLKNREWKFVSTHLLKDTIQFLIKYRPKYMMLPADYPHPKAKLLPKVLTQALGIVVIGYTESNSGKASNQLVSLGLEYNLYPPISGPQIVRFFAKVQKEEQLKKEKAQSMNLSNERQSADDKATASANSHVIQGGTAGSQKGPAYFPDSQVAAQTAVNEDQAKVDQLLSQIIANQTSSQSKEKNNDKGSGEIANLLSNLFSDGDEKSKGPSVMVAKGRTSSQGAYNPQTPASDSSNNNFNNFGSPTFESGSDPNSSENDEEFYSRKQKKDANNNWVPMEKSDPDYNESEESDDSSQSGISGSAGAKKNKKKSKLKSNSSSESEGTGTFAGGNSFSQNANAPERDKETQNSGGKSSNVRIVNSKYDTIILKGSVEALDRSVQIIRNKKELEKVENSTQVACMVIDSPHIKGYLIAALGKNRKVDEAFMLQVRQHLFEFLKARGEVLKDIEPETMSLDIKNVNFQEWAKDQAEFLLQAVHHDNEMALAFFPTAEMEVKLEKSAHENMLKMQLNDIADNTPLDFDIFIYLPVNGKYIRYNKQGQRMFGDQKKRLKGHGVTHIHLKKDSHLIVKKYKARNYINAKIAEYESRTKKLV